MDSLPQSRPCRSRRDILKSSALALLPRAILSANRASLDHQTMTANGGTFEFCHRLRKAVPAIGQSYGCQKRP
jgi:hypothetical protein